MDTNTIYLYLKDKLKKDKKTLLKDEKYLKIYKLLINNNPLSDVSKNCKVCNTTKPLQLFYHNRKICKECFKLKQNEKNFMDPPTKLTKTKPTKKPITKPIKPVKPVKPIIKPKPTITKHSIKLTTFSDDEEPVTKSELLDEVFDFIDNNISKRYLIKIEDMAKIYLKIPRNNYYDRYILLKNDIHIKSITIENIQQFYNLIKEEYKNEFQDYKIQYKYEQDEEKEDESDDNGFEEFLKKRKLIN